MADIAVRLQSKYAVENRYANFGPAIRSIRVYGFRGIDDLAIDFDFPISAFSGLNGSGKSTIGQLLICAYKKPSTAIDYKRYYVKDFFPVSIADPAPFEVNARVLFFYETNNPNIPQEVTISRVRNKWSGYKRQPERYCYYVGFTLYIPKVEHRDLSIYRGKFIELRDKREMPEHARSTVAKIINQPYDHLYFQGIGHKDKEVELGLASRYGSQYSENNMGFGEGRVLYMVDLMETTPEQSLFILEEPETSLHEEAQYRLAKYLVEVCDRRHHQVILTTHSSVILSALPPECRKLLHRDRNGVTEYPGISSTHARAILSGGHEKALTVCVEDDFAKLLVREIVRHKVPNLLKLIQVEAIGSKKAVINAVKLLERLDKKAIGVRDGDVGDNKEENLYSLPGSRPPETEVYSRPEVVERLQQSFDLDVRHILGTNPDLDPHQMTEILAGEAVVFPEALSTFAVQAYVESLDEAEYEAIIEAISENV